MKKTKKTISSPEELLAQLDIDVVSVGREISARCPFHVDAHPSFSMNAKTGLWICYQCGERGSLQDLIEKISGEGANAVEMLREIKYKKAKNKKVEEEPEPEPEVPGTYELEAHLNTFRRPPQWALDERRLTKESIEAYDIRWDHGWVIPIHSPEGELLGWQFKRMKFVSNYPAGVKKSQTLFGLKNVTSGRVVLVESPLDVVRLHGKDVKAVASFGAFVSRVQIQLLKETADRVVLALDNDEEGWRQTDKIFPQLARTLPTIKAVYPAKDPGDLTNRQIERAFG